MIARVPKPRSASATEMLEYVLPQHANLYGTVFGGQIMAWVDLCAVVCAQRHAGRPCVTAFVDDLLFKRPVRVGQVVRLRAHITATFRTSMEIEVSVLGEDTVTGEQWPTRRVPRHVRRDERRAQADARPAAPPRVRRRARGARRGGGAPARSPREEVNGLRGRWRPDGGSLIMRHDGSESLGAESARRRDGHRSRLALQQALERQAPLPRGARRQRHRPVRRLQGQTSSPELFARGRSHRAGDVASRSPAS